MLFASASGPPCWLWIQSILVVFRLELIWTCSDHSFFGLLSNSKQLLGLKGQMSNDPRQAFIQIQHVTRYRLLYCIVYSSNIYSAGWSVSNMICPLTPIKYSRSCAVTLKGQFTQISLPHFLTYPGRKLLFFCSRLCDICLSACCHRDYFFGGRRPNKNSEVLDHSK